MLHFDEEYGYVFKIVRLELRSLHTQASAFLWTRLESSSVEPSRKTQSHLLFPILSFGCLSSFWEVTPISHPPLKASRCPGWGEDNKEYRNRGCYPPLRWCISLANRQPYWQSLSDAENASKRNCSIFIVLWVDNDRTIRAAHGEFTSASIPVHSRHRLFFNGVPLRFGTAVIDNA